MTDDPQENASLEDDLALRDDGPPKPPEAMTPPIPPATLPQAGARRDGGGDAADMRPIPAMDALLERLRFIERRREGWWSEAQRRVTTLAGYAVALASLMQALMLLLGVVLVRWDVAPLVVALLFLLAVPVAYLGSGKTLAAGLERLARAETFKGSRYVPDLLGVMGVVGGWFAGLALLATTVTLARSGAGLFPGLVLLAAVVVFKMLGSLLLWNAKTCLGLEEVAGTSPSRDAGLLAMRAISRVMAAMMPWVALGFSAVSLVLAPVAALWAWCAVKGYNWPDTLEGVAVLTANWASIVLLALAVTLPMLMYLGSLALDLLIDVVESAMNKAAPAEGKDKEQ